MSNKSTEPPLPDDAEQHAAPPGKPECDASSEHVPARRYRVTVRGLPPWIDAERLLGDGAWALAHSDETVTAQCWLNGVAAADVAARLRGVGLGGRLVEVHVDPGLPRRLVRQARLVDARRRRDATPGFTKAGARLDDEGRFSLTPESLAFALGSKLAQRVPQATVIDVCTGAGGNAIGFARAGHRVCSIEQDAGRLALARHNATLYGVAHRIQFMHGDARALLGARSASTPFAGQQADLVFIDPPWRADWNRACTTLADLPLLAELLPLVSRRTAATRVWSKVPPSFDPESVHGASPEAWFGRASGDLQRIKFLLIELTP